MDWIPTIPIIPQLLSLQFGTGGNVPGKYNPRAHVGKDKTRIRETGKMSCAKYRRNLDLMCPKSAQHPSQREERSYQLMACGPYRPRSGQKASLIMPSRTPHASLCNLICNQLQVITHCLSSIGTRHPWENNELQLMTIRDYCLVASLIAHPSTGAIEHPPPPQSTTVNK